MKLSVILPCFNGAATIAEQLDALTQQHWAEGWEVIVINNGSTDNSMTIVESYRDRLPNLQIVNAYQPPAPRRGVAYSYTVGFAAATGDAFLLCEADDQVGEGWLTTMGNALQHHAFVAAALEYHKLNPWLQAEGWQQQSAAAGLSTISPPLFLPYASGCSLGLRREVYEAVGNPDEACTASWDTDYCWRSHLAGLPLHFIPEAQVHYRLRYQFGARYHQGRNWGRAHVMLYLKHSPSPITLLKIIKHYIRSLLKLLPHLGKLVFCISDRNALADWIWGFGWCIGDWQGSQYLWDRVKKNG